MQQKEVIVAEETKKIKVGLFGFYGYGNFGDDLMAVLFGRFLQQQNLEVVVYKLCRPYAEAYNFRVAETVPGFLNGTGIVIIGGGGLFISGKYGWWRRGGFGLGTKLATREKEYDLVLDVLSRDKIPLYALSVGGNGAYPNPLRPAYKERVLRMSRYVSTRNPNDMRLLQRAGTPGDFFPDVVWQTSAFFPAQTSRRTRIRVGFDIYLSNIIRRHAVYLPFLLYVITRLRRDIQFVYIDTTNKSKSPFRALHWPRSKKNTTTYQFHKLFRDLEFITSLDLVVSTRLHLGIACMSYGIPFISLFGERKTRLCLENMGLSRHYFSHRRIFDFMSLMLSTSKLDDFIKDFSIPGKDELMKRSFDHFKKIREIHVEHRMEENKP